MDCMNEAMGEWILTRFQTLRGYPMNVSLVLSFEDSSETLFYGLESLSCLWALCLVQRVTISGMYLEWRVYICDGCHKHWANLANMHEPITQTACSRPLPNTHKQVFSFSVSRGRVVHFMIIMLAWSWLPVGRICIKLRDVPITAASTCSLSCSMARLSFWHTFCLNGRGWNGSSRN
jgi:hypothetical protein